ncbi:MAG: cupin domain-containing protein, partial [Chloroflexi bacterium]|nr:cupin domain-containing protein [Chloroflexota bacterium]
YHIGNQVYALSPGDTLLFEATQPHCFLSMGKFPAIVLLVFQASEGSHLARRYHLDT